MIETPAVSYDKNSFRITKGRWEIGADGYFALKNEVDVTNQIPINFNGNSFTIDFTNVQGEGYYIKYDMSFHIDPSIKKLSTTELVAIMILRCLWTK